MRKQHLRVVWDLEQWGLGLMLTGGAHGFMMFVSLGPLTIALES